MLMTLSLGVVNSFPDNTVRMKFLQKYYQLLCHKKFPMKEPKLVLIGAPDSGKTSWIFPFYGKLTSYYVSITAESFGIVK